MLFEILLKLQLKTEPSSWTFILSTSNMMCTLDSSHYCNPRLTVCKLPWVTQFLHQKEDKILHLTLGGLVNVNTQLRSNHLQQLADRSRLEWEVVILALDQMLLVHVIIISKQKKDQCFWNVVYGYLTGAGTSMQQMLRTDQTVLIFWKCLSI